MFVTLSGSFCAIKGEVRILWLYVPLFHSSQKRVSLHTFGINVINLLSPCTHIAKPSISKWQTDALLNVPGYMIYQNRYFICQRHLSERHLVELVMNERSIEKVRRDHLIVDIKYYIQTFTIYSLNNKYYFLLVLNHSSISILNSINKCIRGKAKRNANLYCNENL